MIHFFRRIRQKLLANNQMKKYLLYAIGEIALVMIGILLALQINNWNEGRKEKLEEKAILIRLKSDFESNQDLINEVITYQRQVSRRMRALLDIMGTNHLKVEQDSLIKYLGAIPFIPKYSPIKGNISSIISSGKISLISNENLNVILTEWPGLMDDYDYGQNILYDLSKQQWMDYTLKMFPFREVEVDIGNGSTGRSKFIYDMKRITNSMEVETFAEFKRVDVETALYTLEKLEVMQNEILEIIKLELEQ